MERVRGCTVVEPVLLYFDGLMILYFDGLLRKLRNSKFGQGLGFWFVGATVILYHLKMPKSVIILIKNENSLFFKPRNFSEDDGESLLPAQTKNLNLGQIWSYGVFSLGHRFIHQATIEDRSWITTGSKRRPEHKTRVVEGGFEKAQMFEYNLLSDEYMW